MSQELREAARDLDHWYLVIESAIRHDAPRDHVKVMAALKRLITTAATVAAGHVEIAHDGFAGDIIGHYVTREGKRGVVVQQDGTRVVHVYGEKWLAGATQAS